MKIFISHSSKDKWAARRISEDLITSGAQTFLDEKDIETGQSIDAEIRLNLKDCDDFLILLSPASIKSDWVLIELGGAMALEKRIIPILLYVGANEIPQAINLKLARDINSVDLYYNEVKQRVSGKKNSKSQVKRKVSKHTYKIGDKVVVVSNRPKDIFRNDSLIDWELEMDQFLGRESIIAQLSRVEEGYNLEIDNHSENQYYNFAKEWLIPIE